MTIQNLPCLIFNLVKFLKPEESVIYSTMFWNCSMRAWQAVEISLHSGTAMTARKLDSFLCSFDVDISCYVRDFTAAEVWRHHRRTGDEAQIHPLETETFPQLDE